MGTDLKERKSAFCGKSVFITDFGLDEANPESSRIIRTEFEALHKECVFVTSSVMCVLAGGLPQTILENLNGIPGSRL